jgi:predicted ATPase
MLITKLVLKNWRNFREAELDLRDCSYLVGANATGKSNLLDAFRFLRDLSKSKGGGLQYAVADRGGMQKLRCLHARGKSDVSIEVHLAEEFDQKPNWVYRLDFKKNDTKQSLLLVSHESVTKDGKQLFTRPTNDDLKDPQLLTQTYLEQIGSNGKFRDVVELFGQITYLHLIPHLLKFENSNGNIQVDDDPFGKGFLNRVSHTPTKTRDARLRKIQKALKVAVPNFSELRFIKDETTGAPHLEACYEHHRPHGAWQREDQFSDGTLRLLGILWSLLDGSGVLLIEEPELSLNAEVVKQIPAMIDGIQRNSKTRRQVIITTHSEALLSNEGIDTNGIAILLATKDGTKVEGWSKKEQEVVDAGFTVAQAVLPRTKPVNVDQLSLF